MGRDTPIGGEPQKKATPAAARNAVKAFTVVVDVGPPIMKICRKGETAVAAQDAVVASLVAADTRAPPGELTGRGRHLWQPGRFVEAP